MADCLAAVINEPLKPLELRRVTIPELEPKSVLIKVDAATLCGTDAHRWQGHMGEDGNADMPFISATVPPFIPGHETTGTIVDMRGALTDILGEPLKNGDRIITSYPHCGECYYCRVARQTTLCANCISFGHSRADKFPYLLGGCAEYHYFPPKGSFIKIPPEVPAPLAASAACALRTVMHGFEQLGGIASHETVLVQGCGPLGLYSTAVARDRGARRILVIGAPESRLQVAREWGADEVLNIDKIKDHEKRVEWVRDQTSGRGPDIVFQCANSHAIPEGLRMIRPGGRFVNIGVTGGPALNIPPMMFFRGVRMSCVVMAEARHFYQAIEFLATRRKHFPFEKIISGTYTLDKTTEALKAMAEFREVKPLILPTVAAAN
jgi:threonine dehydrogenase-like Zn-dependent dehydrogenase